MSEGNERPAVMPGETKSERRSNFWATAKRLLGLLKPERVGMLTVLFFTAVSVLLTVIAPKVLGFAMDVIYEGVIGEGVDFDELRTLILIVLVLYVVASVLMWAQGYVLNRLTMRVMYRLREDVEAKLNRLPLGYYDTRQRGDVISRVTNDVDNVQSAMQEAFSQLVQSVLTVVGIGIMMFVVSWQMALLAIAVLPVAAIIMAVIGTRSQKLFAAQWEHTGAVNGHIEEFISGYEVVRAFGREKESLEEFDGRNEALFKASFGAQALSGSIMPAMTFVSYLSYVLVAVAGGLRIASGQMSLGDATAFIQYSREFTQPIGEISSVANMLQSGIASAARTFELLDAEEEEPDRPTTREPTITQGHVEFDRVEFSYLPGEPVIRDLTLTVAPGATVAIVGPTGAGKTTLVNLLMRFYEISSGAITLDGVDTLEIPRDRLRSSIGMVLQDAWVFKGTIRENIRYGRLDATDAELEEAARVTMVDRFVRHLPDGYDTIIDNDSGTLSAGERQLVTIARAYLSQPALLVLDEATSSVDTRTEQLVQDAMSALRQGRTSFVIAHRLSTIRDADTILVMQDGDIVEMGTHAELLERGGLYADLHQAQLDGEQEEIVEDPDAYVTERHGA